MRSRLRRLVATSATLIALIMLIAPSVGAQFDPVFPPGSHAFDDTWARTDKPVKEGQVSRTWMWGPQAFTGLMMEEYAESPGGERLVQYFDKARMEINHPIDGLDVPDNPWYVTNGLLVVEMVTGDQQNGDSTFVDREPADIQIAGDYGQDGPPTYADIHDLGLRSAAATPEGALLNTLLTNDNQIVQSDEMGLYNQHAGHRVQVPGIDHTVAAIFWDFMNQTTMVYEDGNYIQDKLFLDPFYATGYPITEAYWSVVPVDGQGKAVLWQCFERRCLTFTPGNPLGFQVEAGNVGQHYYSWRYGESQFDSLSAYMVALNGLPGVPTIGCEDSLVATTVHVPAGLDTSEQIKTVLAEGLFSVDSQTFGSPDVYNALHQSNLQVASVTVNGSEATVEITGDVLIGGVCDEPRFIEQIQQTVLDVPGVDSAIITVNGTPLADLFSQATEMMNVQVFLVAVEDNGQSGPLVGCGDSLIGITRQVEASSDTATIIERALSSLFSIEDESYGESGLRNALYQSDLTVDSVTMDGTEATVELSGELLSGGVCDDPRIVGQIQETVLAVDGVDSAVITVNGTPLEDYFDLSGE